MAAQALTSPVPLFLAPMAEFTTPAMRTLCERFGAARTFTEMVNAEGLCRGNPKTRFLLETFPEEKNVWAHLYGSEPGRLAEAARLAEATGRFKGIDLNAGCPVPRITAQGAGSALLRDLPRFGAILAAVVKAVSLPVTVKTRLGPNPQRPVWREALRRAEDAGVAAIAVHARYTSQGHGGAVHLETLRALVESASIPVYGNGSVADSGSAQAMAETGVAAILVARAALDSPTVFGKGCASPRDLALEHLALELRYRRLAQPFASVSAEAAAVLTFRRHLFRYFKGMPGANALRGNLMNLKTLADIKAALESFG